ncbi:MAG: hypothetical protein AAF725_13880 [Acidobacteriota bacterium]
MFKIKTARVLWGVLWAAAMAAGGAPEIRAEDSVIVLEIGKVGGEAGLFEVDRVLEGPPSGEKRWLEIPGFAPRVGVMVGLLDAEQQVVEVHLFASEEEAAAQLLVEPDVRGFAEMGEGVTLAVALRSVRREGETPQGG